MSLGINFYYLSRHSPWAITLTTLSLRILLVKKQFLLWALMRKMESTDPGPATSPQSSMEWQHLPTYLLFVPFWVLNKHHHVSLPSTDGVHSELGWLLHHVSCRLNSCQVDTRTLQAAQGLDNDHYSPCFLQRTERRDPALQLPCGRQGHLGQDYRTGREP